MPTATAKRYLGGLGMVAPRANPMVAIVPQKQDKSLAKLLGYSPAKEKFLRGKASSKEEKYLAQQRLKGLGEAVLGGADLANMVINAGVADFNYFTGGLGTKRDVELPMASQAAADLLTEKTGTKLIRDEEVSPEIRKKGANTRALMGMIPTGAEDVVPSGAAVQGILHGLPNLFKKPALEDLAKGLGGPRIKAYHGSPHSFDEFDISKIGTGEGAQAYGHGLYFAENEGVAKSYRDTLAGKKKWEELGFSVDELLPMMGANTPELQSAMRPYVTRDLDRMIDFLDEEGGGIEAARAIVAKKGYASGAGTVTYPPEFQEAIAQKLAAAHAAKKGSMYEVDIAADPEAFLDWDRPLKDQPKAVQDWLAKRDPDMYAPGGSDYDAEELGQSIYNRIVDQTDKAKRGSMPYKERVVAGTEQLKQAGIPGIKYLDAGSRMSDEAAAIVKNYGSREKAMEIAQTRLKNASLGDIGYWQKIVDDLKKPEGRNYVVFDPKIISIVKKYGIAAALGAGLISEEMARQMQAQGEV